LNGTERLIIKGGRIITSDQILDGFSILVEAGLIKAIEPSFPDQSAAVIDAQSLYVSPGFIDMHIQGVLGRDVWEVETDGIEALCMLLPRFGCTAFLPTTNYDEEHLPRLCARIASEHTGAQTLGLHLEGPFVHPQRRGALKVQTELPVSLENAKRVLDYSRGLLKLITLAPELPGCLDVVSFFSAQGVLPSLGHTDSSFEIVQQAAARGLKHATHCFNAMRPLNHREPGAVGAALLTDEISVQVVSDNHHLHPAMYDLIARVKPWEKIILVTDSIQAAGQPPGRYNSVGHGKEIFLKEDGTVRLADGTLAGSALTINQALQNFYEQVECSLPEAVRLVTANPAKTLRVDHLMGSIKPGYQADLVLFDEAFNVRQTLVKGQTVFLFHPVS